MSKRMEEPDRPQITVLYGAFWVNKATDTHSIVYVILLLFYSNSGFANMPHSYVLLQGGSNMTGTICM
jgi:hypothetical protein